MKFFTKHYAGLDIADHTIEVALLAQNHQGISIESKNRISLPPGIVSRGRIVDGAMLAEHIDQLFADTEFKKIKSNQIIFGVPESQVYMHTFVVDGDEANSSRAFDIRIKTELAANIPIPIELLTYGVAKLKLEGSTPKIKVTVAAAEKTFVNEWKNFFSENNLQVTAFDPEPLALARGLFTNPPTTPSCVADIGATTTLLAIFDRTGFCQSFSIPVAGFAATMAIDNKTNTTYDMAETMKIANGLTGDSQVAAAMSEVIDQIISEMKAVLTYSKENNSLHIQEIILAGGSSRISGLPEKLQLAMNDCFPDAAPNIRIGTSFTEDTDDNRDHIESTGLARRGLDPIFQSSDPEIPMIFI